MPSENGDGRKPERVGLYMRVSSEEQKTKETIETRTASSGSIASSTATR